MTRQLVLVHGVQMLEHAQNLEFEEAAALRDQLQEIREAKLLA